MARRPLHVLQFGASGQLARELTRILVSDESVSHVALARADADFAKPEEVADIVRSTFDVDVVVNTVAYTAVDRAETDRACAECVNMRAVGALAEACRDRGVPLMHVSTDYVYDGTKPAPYLESDATNPLNVYGETKLGGEALIRDTLRAHVIVRTSWLYSAHGANFVKTMIRLGREREELRVVDDQWGAPTSATDLAQALAKIALALGAGEDESLFGTYHFANAGETTWCRFAEEIFRLAPWAESKARVISVGTADYPTPARRPANSRLDTTKIGSRFGIAPPPWEISLMSVLHDLKGHHS